ncbi:hypothetical protein AB1N83_012304 [Pleurotus pulmonarius]
MLAIDWTPQRICDVVQKHFQKRACWYQLEITSALYRGFDVVGVAATGSGKTLSFFTPLLMALEEGLDKIIFIVTPLNLLGKQNSEQLNSAGLTAVAVSAENSGPEIIKAIASGAYRVIIINPEILMSPACLDLWKNKKFTSKILNFVFDEGHCVTFVIKDNFKVGDPAPPKFVIFFDSMRETEDAVHYLQSRLPKEYRDRVRWFHATMTSEYRVDEYEAFRQGDVWGLCVTDAFGMGLDLPNIVLVIQWKTQASLCSIWQRIGRAARGEGSKAKAVIFAEKKFLDVNRQKKEKRAANQLITTLKKRQAPNELQGCPPKRIALAPAAINAAQMSEPSADPAVDSRLGIGIITGDNSEEVSVVVIELQCQSYHEQARQYRTISQSTACNHTAIEPALDDMLNAHSRGLCCRRQPPSIYFGNDKSQDDHTFCDDTNPEGCVQCRPKACTPCCDLCAPELLELFNSTATISQPARAPGQSSIKAYTPSQVDHDLKNALIAWRKDKAPLILGNLAFRRFGVQPFLSNEIIQRIVDCAHMRKIQTFAPQPAPLPANFSTPTTTAGSSVEAVAPPKRTRAPAKTRQCSECKGYGHNKANANCPIKKARREAERAATANHITSSNENRTPNMALVTPRTHGHDTLYNIHPLPTPSTASTSFPPHPPSAFYQWSGPPNT